jgi:polyketide synthase PksN
MWVKGFPLDWTRLTPEHEARRISLPTCSFARNRYWISGTGTPGGASAVRGTVVAAAARTDTATPANEAATATPTATVVSPSSGERKRVALRSLSETLASREDQPVTMSPPRASELSLNTSITPAKRRAGDTSLGEVAGAAVCIDDLRQDLTNSLAEALYMGAAEIDAAKPFVELGLDSIVAVEWMRTINKRHGLTLPATRLYDHPTIDELTAFLAKHLASEAQARTTGQGNTAIQVTLQPGRVGGSSVDDILEQVYIGALDAEHAEALIRGYAG